MPAAGTPILPLRHPRSWVLAGVLVAVVVAALWNAPTGQQTWTGGPTFTLRPAGPAVDQQVGTAGRGRWLAVTAVTQPLTVGQLLSTPPGQRRIDPPPAGSADDAGHDPAVRWAHQLAGTPPVAVWETTAAGQLPAGTRIVAVDGRTPRSDGPSTRELAAGRQLRTLEEDGTVVDRQLDQPVAVRRVMVNADPQVQLEQVSGRSADLARALALADAVTVGDATGGRIIAATGRLDRAGGLQPVGGIDAKAAAAAAAGAQLLLVPTGQVPDDPPLEVVAVATADEAWQQVQHAASAR